MSRFATVFYLACLWTGIWLMIGSPIAMWYGPPVNPAMNSGVLVVWDGPQGAACLGYEFTGNPGFFEDCG